MKNKILLKYLVLLHIVIISLSNFLVSIPIEVIGVKLTLAAFSFPLVVVATDLTVRLVGKSIAQKTISFAFPFAIVSSFLILYYEQNLISIAIRISLASSVASSCSAPSPPSPAKSDLFFLSVSLPSGESSVLVCSSSSGC